MSQLYKEKPWPICKETIQGTIFGGIQMRLLAECYSCNYCCVYMHGAPWNLGIYCVSAMGIHCHNSTRFIGFYRLNSIRRQAPTLQHIFCHSKHACNVCQTFILNLDGVRMRFCSLSFIVLEAAQSITVATGNHVSAVQSWQFCVKTSASSSIFSVRWMLTRRQGPAETKLLKLPPPHPPIDTCWWIVKAVNIVTGNKT